MQALAGISFVLLVVASWVAGVRLLVLYRQTRSLPELCLGFSVILLTGTGYPLAVIGQAESVFGLTLCRLIQHSSNIAIDTGMWLVFVFTWRVFRQHAVWARVAVIASALGFAVHFVAVVIALGKIEAMSESMDATRYWGAFSLGTGALAYAWSSVESLRYHATLKRRLRLGLADPVVANRFVLWTGMGAAVVAGAIINIHLLIIGADVLASPAALTLTSFAGGAQAAFLYLAFVPPARYLSWLTARS